MKMKSLFTAIALVLVLITAALPLCPVRAQLSMDVNSSESAVSRYLRDSVQSRLQASWKEVTENDWIDTAVRFTLLSSGNVSRIEIEKSSSVEAVDEAAVACVKSAAPFAPLPKGITEPINLRVVFFRKSQSLPLSARSISWTSAPSEEPVSVNFGPYMKDLQRKLRESWLPFGDDRPMKVGVEFLLDRGGHVSELHVVKSSGLSAFDQAALKTISNAAPFSELPVNSPDSISLTYEFDQNSSGTLPYFDENSKVFQIRISVYGSNTD